jgi:hypothetical protein
MRFTVRRSAAFCCRFDNGVFVLWRQLAVLRGFVCVKERAKGVSGRWRLVAIDGRVCLRRSNRMASRLC